MAALPKCRILGGLTITDDASRTVEPVRIGAESPAPMLTELQFSKPKEQPVGVLEQGFAAIVAAILLFFSGLLGAALLYGLGAAVPILLLALFLKKR